MKKAVSYLFFTLLLINCGNQPSKQTGDVQILFEIRPEVNYVTHLYTLAGLGFSDDEYTAKYGNTLPKAAVDTLQKFRDYLTFGQGEGGLLSGTFFLWYLQRHSTMQIASRKSWTNIRKWPKTITHLMKS